MVIRVKEIINGNLRSICVNSRKREKKKNGLLDHSRFQQPVSYYVALIQRCVYPVVEATDDAEGDDAEGTDGEGQFCVAIALESRQWIRLILDIHRLDDKKVVVKTHHRIDQCDENDEIRQEIT